MSMHPATHRRRASDVAGGLLKTFVRSLFRRGDTKRSLSTGDLATSPATEEDHMVIDFSQAPTTSTLAASFDDCDRVPMKMCPDRSPQLLPQYRARARALAKNGSADDLTKISIGELHQSQPWFYRNVDSCKAERILMNGGYEEGSFLVYCLGQQYQICLVSNGKIVHLRIAFRIKEGSPRWSLDLDRSFKNLCDLVAYYRSHKGYVLPRKLKNGIARPLRTPHASHRTRA